MQNTSGNSRFHDTKKVTFAIIRPFLFNEYDTGLSASFMRSLVSDEYIERHLCLLHVGE